MVIFLTKKTKQTKQFNMSFPPRISVRGKLQRESSSLRFKQVILSPLFLFFFFSCFLFAQAPDTVWTRPYGGTGWDKGYAIESCFDGCYIVVAETEWPGIFYSWLLKISDRGDTIWTKIYDGEFWAVAQTNDSGFVLTGSIPIAGNGLDAYLLKTDLAGDTLWSRHYGGTLDDIAYAVQQTNDGGYILVGSSYSFGGGAYSDVYIIKTDSLGNMQWQKTYGGTYRDVCHSAKQAIDGGYIFAGYTTYLADPYADVYIIRTDSLGDTVSTKIYGTAGHNEKAQCLELVSSGGYIVAGWTDSFGQGGDIWLLRISDRGDTIWTRTYGGVNVEFGYSVKETGDGGFVIAGHTRSFGSGFEDVYAVKTDSVGDTLWTKTIGGTAPDGGYSIALTPDNGYIIAGTTGSFGSGEFDVYLIKLAVQTGVVEDKNVTAGSKRVYATVIRGAIRLPVDKKCRIFDAMGRQIHTLNPPPGIYFVEINGKIEQKVIKVR